MRGLVQQNESRDMDKSSNNNNRKKTLLNLLGGRRRQTESTSISTEVPEQQQQRQKQQQTPPSQTPKGDNNSNNKKDSPYRVKIPYGLRPGDTFQARVGEEVVRVTCPPDAQPGAMITIKVPKRKTTSNNNNHLPFNSPGVTPTPSPDGREAFLVDIPDNVQGGEKFPVRIKGRTINVTCPRQAVPGMRVRVTPPPPKGGDDASSSACSTQGSPMTEQSLLGGEHGYDFDTELFEVELPHYVRPGHPFALKARGIRVLVNCPINGYPGQKIRFRLPVALFANGAGTPKNASAMAVQRLKYDKDGWSRTVRVMDQQFQWVRMDHYGGIDDRHLHAGRFDPDKSAFCRRLDFTEGADFRVRDGLLALVPAHEATCGSVVRNEQGQAIITYPDLADVQVRSFEQKASWLRQKCEDLEVEWDCGHMHIMVRRNFLIEDSIDALMSLSRRDLRKVWRFEFIGEPALDAGGLTREWFQLVTSAMFDPDLGFWKPLEANQMCMTINPASRLLHSDYLMYYRFMGRIMGKAIFNHQLVAGHMAQFIYKHMLGWPITLNDLKAYDDGYFASLNQIRGLAEQGEDVEMLCMDFTTTVDMMGMKETIDLIQGGSHIPVTNDNYLEYMEACLRYWMMDSVKPQLNQLLLGFFDVIPEPLLTVFDFQELELLMCGLPEIDVCDWMDNTEYAGVLEGVGEQHHTCQWFWEVVRGFDHEMRARLLQFVTGTSGVPARGFGVLQGNDGSIRKFTINGVPVDICLYPRAHTCFNRIDLPMYKTKADLEEKLRLAVSMSATGFDLE